MTALPSGTVTFLFTDIEGSTRLWDTFPNDMRRALGIHHDVLTDAVTAHGGRVVKDTGDGLFTAFGSASDATAAALAAQARLSVADWPDVVGSLGVRMALHTAAIQTTLPAFATTFIGRTSDIDDVAGRLGDRRLITLLGPGGIGKTRLAVEVRVPTASGRGSLPASSAG